MRVVLEDSREHPVSTTFVWDEEAYLLTFVLGRVLDAMLIVQICMVMLFFTYNRHSSGHVTSWRLSLQDKVRTGKEARGIQWLAYTLSVTLFRPTVIHHRDTVVRKMTF